MKLHTLSEDEFDDIETTGPVDDRDHFEEDNCYECGAAFGNPDDIWICEKCEKCKNHICNECMMQDPTTDICASCSSVWH